MPYYSKEFKDSVIQRMMPPNAVSVSTLVKETGVSDSALYKWRKEYRNQGIAVPADNSNPESWSSEDKLAVVFETMPFNEADLSEYCRSKGLYAEQIEQWKQAALSGYQRPIKKTKHNTLEHKKEQKKIKRLEAELRRKDKALAETAALLVLSKKCQAIWGESEEN